MNKLHEIQTHILKKLMFSTGLRYTEMKPNKNIENNQFQFHLDQLTNNGYILKNNNLYTLSEEGKKLIISMDGQSGAFIKQPHVSVRAACVRKNEDENEYLFYTRLKHPYYGCQGFPAGKLEYGEIMTDAVLRELKEETGLTGIPKLICITHYIDVNKEGVCLADKLMFLFIVEDITGELHQCEEGMYEWIKHSEIFNKILKPFESIEVIKAEIAMINNYDGNIKLVEKVSEVESKF